MTLQEAKINVNNFEPQQGKLGKPFTYSALYRYDEDWLYVFKYDDNTFFSLLTDTNEVIKKKFNDKETYLLLKKL